MLYWMTFRKLLIQETEYIQGLRRDAAVKRLKTYPIQRVLTPRIDFFTSFWLNLATPSLNIFYSSKLKPYGKSSVEMFFFETHLENIEVLAAKRARKVQSFTG